jgi:8-oxo-dGTP pyrophosphatase MutT (NUDIX family)
MSKFLRHIQACNTATLPGGRIPFRLGTAPVGWLSPEVADLLTQFPSISRDADAVTLHQSNALPAIALALARQGIGRHRGEAFDVRATPGGPALSTIDRGALPSFGIQAEGIHLNGLVRRADGLHLWVAKRAADKALDPGKLDHIVAGGTPAGHTAWQTLIKEAAEEAAIPEALAQNAREVLTIAYAMDRPEGLRRDLLHCYDLTLPESFTPTPADGEVEHFSLWPIADVLEAVRETEQFKFNVNLVLIDLFLRENLIIGDEARTLRRALDA